MYKITLSDGSVVRANLNENTWESPTEVTAATFEGKTKNVTVEDEGGNVEELGECTYMIGAHRGNVWMFFLNPLTEAEKEKRTLVATIQDLNDQITEIQEVIVEM